MWTYEYTGKLELLPELGWKFGHLKLGEVYYKECYFKGITPGKVYYVTIDPETHIVQGKVMFHGIVKDSSVLVEDVPNIAERGLLIVR